MQVSKTFRFEAAHILPKHPGKCANLHGHSWQLTVELHGIVNKETGFVVDYSDLKRLVQPIVDRFDHQLLNLYINYPSSENLAIHVAHELRSKLLTFPASLSRLVVGVSETENTLAVWDSDEPKDLRIIDHEEQDSVPGALDAPWRSPNLTLPVNPTNEYIQQVKNGLDAKFYAWMQEQQLLTQTLLYQKTLGAPGAIYEELKAVTENNNG